MNDTLNKLFSKYSEIENTILNLSFSNPYDEIVTRYPNGIIIGKYNEQDRELMDEVKSKVSEHEVKRVISICYEDEIKKISSLDYQDYQNEKKLEDAKEKLNDLTYMNLENWIKKWGGWIKDLINVPVDVDDVIGVIYMYYAYKEYQLIDESPYNSNIDNIMNLYNNNDNKLNSLYKYKLIPIDNQRELICVNTPRIYDNEIKKTMFIKNVSLILVNKFQELLNQNLIEKISFRCSNNNILDGKHIEENLLEAVERGSIFSLSNINAYDVTKLYSDNFYNCLWVVIDDSNITFEELCDDFDIYEDKIVTQVIHLQYIQTNNDTIITHLDHEYIFYNEEEYEKRLKNPYQKGNAAHRIKSFKIDKASISFTTPCVVQLKDIYGESYNAQIPLLCLILESYFKHKDLIYEYFQKILSHK
ncbi:hypothetical protein [Clostridium baratii]|uniref:hypothetical protein n=1 Tax=Clostridium baratii TaxID=1561 RepID=UPI0005F2E94A|nr:hypothetical protein [Clostridium baratii]KJU72387.1 hypothetical protein UC77_04445 [Clostridium baratii]